MIARENGTATAEWGVFGKALRWLGRLQKRAKQKLFGKARARTVSGGDAGEESSASQDEEPAEYTTLRTVHQEVQECSEALRALLKIVGGVGGGPDATLGTQLQELGRRQPRNDSFGSTSTRRRRRKQRGSGDVTPAEGAAAEKARLTDALREFEANFERQHRRPPLTEDEYAPVQALREQLRELKRNRSFERPSRRNGEDRGSLGV